MDSEIRLTENITPKSCKFYTRDEIVIHNEPDDFWIIVNNVVFDLTPMIKDRLDSMNPNLQYLLAFGGKNLSHYFDPTGHPRYEISCVTGGKRVAFGPVIETAQSHLCKTPGLFWWQDPFYQIGRLTRQERRLRIINTLTSKIDVMKVCEEDTIYDIQRKYKKLYNSHCGSYVWCKMLEEGHYSDKFVFNKTLTENNIPYELYGIGPPPAIWLFYTDNHTVG